MDAGLKRERRIDRRFVASGLKVKKMLEAFEFPFQPRLDRAAIENLATLRFIDTHEDVLFTGKSGTGKSHILQALVVKACEKEQLVRYTRCVDLVDAPLCRPGRRLVRATHAVVVPTGTACH